jgi:hydrogenase maturation protease
MNRESIAVFGVGNVLLGDDGVGSSVIHLLQSNYEFPDNVELEDLGTPGLELLAHVARHDVVIFVDAVAEDLAPGTVRIYDRDAIVNASPALRVGPHDPALGDTLLALEFAEEGPREAVLIGIVAAETASGIGLSPAVRAALPVATQWTVNELVRRGIPVTERTQPAALETPWWLVESI